MGEIKEEGIPSTEAEVTVQAAPSPVPSSAAFPWRSLLALILGLIGQRFFEPPPTTYPLGYAFYIGAFILFGWAIRRGEWPLPPLAPHSAGNDPQTYRLLPLIASVVLGIGAFVFLGNNLFTAFNLILWLATVACFLWAFWLPKSSANPPAEGRKWFRDPWLILIVAVTLIAFFFRVYQTTTVPPEPFSDHAEKILDVYDVSQGITRVFFPRNTGREAFQMYWTLLIAKIFGTGLSFLSLKLGTALIGLLTLPYMYLLGREVGGRRLGLLVLILTGIAYWPNVISRVGLRFPLYPLFVAPLMFHLVRGLRTRNRNDFILAGIFLGLGLQGKSTQEHVAAVPDETKPVVIETIKLRDRAEKNFSDQDLQKTIKERDFFNRQFNPGGNFPNDFVDNGDGTVTDKVTGLMWQKGGSPSEMLFDAADKYTQELNSSHYGGYGDWRLPTMEELCSLLEGTPNKSGKFIDKLFDSTQELCWSADENQQYI